jgi:glycosyltransferase involved in cell wall biosynthesis
MTARPTLGILITYYNERELIRECVESLLAGTEQPDEILIYDNGADEPAEQYLPPGLPARVIRGDGNKGPSHSRNVLLGVSQSDYVHFQDADDLFAPNAVEKLREALRGSPDLVVNQVGHIILSGERRQAVLPLHTLRAHADLKLFCLEWGMNTQAGTARRALMSKLGGWDETIWHKEDVDVFFRMALADCSYQVIDAPLIFIRQRQNSHSTKPVEAALHSMKFLRKLTGIVPEKYQSIVCDYAGNCGVWLYQAGLFAEAEEAFGLAAKLGTPHYSVYTPKLRFLARKLGVKKTEAIRALWRSLKNTGVRTQSRGGLT